MTKHLATELKRATFQLDFCKMLLRTHECFLSSQEYQEYDELAKEAYKRRVKMVEQEIEGLTAIIEFIEEKTKEQ